MKDEDFEFDDEEDDVDVEPARFDDAVVSSSDWTVDTILSQIRNKNINLNPRFQRRDAWSIKKKSLFIESIILGLPIPQIVLALNKEPRRGNFIVLDGKQRLLTLLQFTGGWNGKSNNFSLQGLKIRADLNGKSFSDIKEDTDLRGDYFQFLNYTIRSVVIRNWPNIDFLHTVFIRLNSKSTPLSPQELRQALFPGEFVLYINKRAGESPGLKVLMGLDEPDFRMRDVEVLLRYLAFSFFITEYRGNLKKFLDDTCDKMNKAWPERKNEVDEKISELEYLIADSGSIFRPENVGRKWTGKKFETDFNRAVFDVISFYFSNDKIRSAALKKNDDVLQSFKYLCENNNKFRNSIESTTKSMNSTSSRLNLWGEELRRVLGMDFNVPVLADKRIIFEGFGDGYEKIPKI